MSISEADILLGHVVSDRARTAQPSNNPDLMEGLRELNNARVAYVKARDYYEGTVEELFAHPRIRRLLAERGLDFTVRLSKIPVDAVAERLEISSITTGVPETDLVVQQLWEENNLLMVAPAVHFATSEYGDCYMIVWPNNDGGVDMFYNTPLNVRIIYDAEKPNRKRYAVKEWVSETDEKDRPTQHRANLYYADRIERYETVPNRDGDEDSDWLPRLDDDDEDDGSTWQVDNTFGQVPVFHFRNGYPYGTPEHEAAYGPQNAVNKLVITQMVTVDYQGFPQRYALEDLRTSLEGSDDIADFGDDDTEAVQGDENLQDDDSSLESGPGELWMLRGQRGVGQFGVADPDAFLKPLDHYVRLMASVTNKPLHFFDPMGDSPSGEALRAKEAPLTKRVVYVRQFLAQTWREAYMFALSVLDIENVSVDVRWTSPASIDDLDGWRTNQIKIELGVPDTQVLLESGYSETQVTEWLPATTPEMESEQP